MDYTTLKEFADQHGISYEAARKSFARYEADLEGHTITKDRTRMLDEYAVKFLEEKRRSNPVVVVNEDAREEIRKQAEEIESLKAQLLAAQNELLAAQQACLKVKDRVIELQETARAALIMKEDLERQKQETEDLREQQKENEYVIKTLMQERNEARAEADSYTKSLFGFYRRKK